MVTEEQVRQSLEALLVPAVKRSIVGMNLVREVTTSDKKVNVTLASTGLIPGAQDWIKTKAREAIEKLPEVNDVNTTFISGGSAGDAKHLRDTWAGDISVKDTHLIAFTLQGDGKQA